MYFAFLASFLALILGLYALILIPRSEHRLLAIAGYLILTTMIYGSALEVMGKAKPMALEWRSFEGLPVIGLKPDKEAKVVYLWALRDGVPMTYVMPMPGDDEAAKTEAKFRQRYQTGDTFYLTDEEEPQVEVETPRELPVK